MTTFRKRRPSRRTRRRSEDGRGEGRVVRVGSYDFVDPFPGVLGTKPEKMVLAEMVRRQVPFSFQHEIGDISWTPEVEDWRVDFFIPSTKTILEVNGDYWHTMGERPEQDAYRYAVLEEDGYRVLVWWESDILMRMWEMFEEEPTLANPPVKGPPVKLENDIDDLRAVRRMNSLRRTRLTGTSAVSTRRRRSRSVR